MPVGATSHTVVLTQSPTSSQSAPQPQPQSAESVRKQHASLSGATLARVLGADASEVAFFSQLSTELRKVANHYVEVEDQLASRFITLIAAFRDFHAEEALQLMADIVKFYMALLQLENFAVMNYCGFGKILKKHDKLTGYSTKTAYMQVMVNPQSFAQYRRLLRMLMHTEAAYTLLANLTPPDGTFGTMEAEDASRLADLREVQGASRHHWDKEAREVALAHDVDAGHSMRARAGAKRARSQSETSDVLHVGGLAEQRARWAGEAPETDASMSDSARQGTPTSSMGRSRSELELAAMLAASGSGQLGN